MFTITNGKPRDVRGIDIISRAPKIGDIVGDSWGVREVLDCRLASYQGPRVVTHVQYRHKSHLGKTWKRWTNWAGWAKFCSTAEPQPIFEVFSNNSLVSPTWSDHRTVEPFSESNPFDPIS